MSDADLHGRAAELFLALRELPPAERATALARAAGDDARLREEVASLLEHDDGAPRSLDGMPEHIGPYRVLSRLGAGGTGHVFLAVQLEPVQRRVAVKVVPEAALSPELSARFDVERRALESVEHPNVARILDAGTTVDGLPYLVMEHVDGAAIDAFCEDRGLSLPARIELAQDVAAAIEHAHRRGVIHRDLKPANVLVQEVDGRPIARVLDFGIAKPISADALENAPRTAGLPLGTPSYMAPEQTGLAPVDTRTDVYGLGALLYELAAGRPPVLRADDPLETLRRVREDAPPPASRARRLRGAPASLVADLDAVLARALEKDPDRRYPSVAALADDLGRLLRSEPVAARPPALAYRAARFARRRRGLVAALTAVAAAVLLGVAGLAAGFVEAARGRRAAEDENLAQQELNRFLTEDLLGGASPDAYGAEVPVRLLLDRASQKLEGRFPDRPLVAAALHHTLASVYSELDELDSADTHVARALALRRESGGPDSPDVVRTEILEASLLMRRERPDDALAVYAELLPRARLVLDPDDPELYTALNDMGVALDDLGRHAEAAAALEEALAGRSRLYGPRHRLVLISSSNLALACEQSGQVERTLELLREAVRIAETTPGESRMTLLGLQNNLGATLQDLDRDEEASPHLRRAAELAAELLGPKHAATLTIRGNLAGLEAELGDPARAAEMYAEIAEIRTEEFGPDALPTLTARYGYWNALRLAGRDEEAAAGFGELAAAVETSLGPDHWLTAQTLASLARALLDSGRPDEALPFAERAEERLLDLYGPDHVRTKSASDLVRAIRGE